MADRLTTGLSGLDAQLGGGVPPGTVHVLIGEPMNALELFAYHFAAAGTQTGGALFVSQDLAENEVKGGVRAVGGRPERVKVAPGGDELPSILKGARYVLESFSPMTHRLGWEAVEKELVKLKAQVRQSGSVALIIAIDGLHEATEIARLKMWADGVLQLGFDRQGFGLYPFLKVTKMRGVPDSARFLLFKETEKGLFMESTRRVF